MNTVKSLMLLLLCCIVVSCGKKEIVIKNSEGVKFTSYQEACSVSDFSSAHRYIDRMRAEYNSKGRRSQFSPLNIDEAEKYVFREEALYLMSQGSEAAKQRIIYLLKQYPSDSNCDMLVELAIEYDQEDFVKSLTRHYESNISSSILRKIVEYLYLEKGDENTDFVYTLLNRYDKIDLLLHAAIEKEDMALVNSLAKNYKGDMPSDVLRKIIEYLYIGGNGNKEDLDFVCTLLNRYGKIDLLLHAAIEKEDVALVKKLVKSYKVVLSISELEKVAHTFMKARDSDIEGMITSSIIKLQPSGAMPIEDHDYKGPSLYEPVLKYIDETNKYNTICLKMLDLAIQNKNRSLAKKIVSIVKPSYDYRDYRNYSGTIDVESKNEKAIDEAKKKLKEAIAAGLI